VSVGGDKYGWGMIGTQALWHDRRKVSRDRRKMIIFYLQCLELTSFLIYSFPYHKIRGDYGATFRTGSTIIVTLDTDAGTLSFSSWRDSSLSSTFSLDSSQGLTSPRRQSLVGGTVEDWGVAFEGLPLDCRLHPAVGLYQRDDRVSLLTVESGNRMFGSDISGKCYFPKLRGDCYQVLEQEKLRVRHFNSSLSWEGIQYVTHLLKKAPQALKEQGENFFVRKVLPSLAASLCLLPRSVPVLSARTAIALLPHLRSW